jgi:hypothetical protein
MAISRVVPFRQTCTMTPMLGLIAATLLTIGISYPKLPVRFTPAARVDRTTFNGGSVRHRGDTLIIQRIFADHGGYHGQQ